ncbi:P-loop containing nucleoside triphosphate hydrolase protein [Cyathus striatus]|nr:P-loop containing nucleoside triphosphate hydrolase protein [Cyathus striatus]
MHWSLRKWYKLYNTGQARLLSTRRRQVSSIALRPYQEQCIDACLAALESGITRIGASLPTGSGKTTVFISLLSRLKPPTSNHAATRALIIVNSVELARQSAEQVARLFPSWSVEIEQGAKHNATGLADVTVATYQTLIRNERLMKFTHNFLKAIIIDEAHHAAAPSYRRLLAQFDSDIKHPDETFKALPIPHKIPIIGFSATFSRHDGLALGSVFQHIVYHRDFLEMIKEQWLCDVRFTSVCANIDLKNVTINKRTGDFNPTSLAHVVNTDAVNQLVVRTWMDRASTRKSTLVFCVNIAHVHSLTQTFRSFGIDARYVYSETPIAERKALIADFKDGQFPVLINCAILTEGADIPNIDCLIVARPTRSRNVFAQMIGRGMRLSPDTGKEDCRIIDFVDSVSRVAGVVSTPTLFGLDPGEIAIDDETIESLERKRAETYDSGVSGDVPNPKSVSYTDYENAALFLAHTSGDAHIARLSRNAWTCCGDDIYVLECLGKGHLRIEPVEANEATPRHFIAYYTPAALDSMTAHAFRVSPYLRRRKILTADALHEAVKGCDTYATTKVLRGSIALGLLRTARWRKQPASSGQKDILKRRWNRRGDPKDVAKRIANMTKGESADIISRIRHGAQARFDKKRKADTKLATILLKEQQRLSREIVRVGPISE